MKKNLLVLSLVLFLGTGITFAKSGIFDFGSNSSTGSASNAQKVDLSPVKSQTTTPTLTKSSGKNQGLIQKENFEAAIQNLDSAQVEVRDELAHYTQIYNEALVRYNASKEECRALRSQIRTIKSKIRTIERTKKSINKQIIKYYDN